MSRWQKASRLGVSQARPPTTAPSTGPTSRRCSTRCQILLKQSALVLCGPSCAYRSPTRSGSSLGEFIGPVLAAPPEDEDTGISRLELIRAAVYVPMREMRELLHRLVDEGPADERLEAAHALALARDAYGAAELLAQLASQDRWERTRRGGSHLNA